MKGLFSILLFTICLISFGQQKPGFELGELIVQIDPNVDPYSLSRKIETETELGITEVEELSDIASIYRIAFADKTLNLDELERILFQYPQIWQVQKNHFVTVRETIPNEPSFDELWHLKNDGSTGGTVDADIDATDAWDITTGGTTTHSDDIVVCVIEGGGVDIWHEDLIGNIWTNTAEDGSDGVDNDGNGYIDDSLGWNVADLNDDVGAGSHGTRVAGMIGATADNSIGVAGVNWNVKLMIVKGQAASNEASVIAAYNYPLKMRKMYNESFGAEGAFVVCTNSSWGINNGDPEDAPLWCAMYDSLGMQGILSIGATTNNNLNVDEVGDLPTTCSSDYLIGVTMTNSDDIRAGSGYGPINVDLAAPGQGVKLPTPGDSYTSTSGTSFATPCVAGAVALAYSTPCADFINYVKYNPATAALVMKDYILDNVDVLAALTGEVGTSGRLNVNNTINAIMTDCDPNTCIAPYDIHSTTLTDSVVDLEWSSFTTDHIIYITEGAGPAIEIPVAGTSFSFDTLTPCTYYTIEIKALCPIDDTSILSYPFEFKTDGCCDNPPLALDLKTNDELTIEWGSVLYATQYNIRYREEGTTTWTEETDVNSPFTASGLEECTFYEFQIYTLCTDSTQGYSESQLFRTLGCGICTEGNYCEISGANDNQEWIDSIAINGYSNFTGANGGWLQSGTIITAITPDETYTLRIVPGYSSTIFTETFSCWVDYDHSGTFEPSEKVIDGLTNNGPVEGDITVPSAATLGITKIRIGMSALSDPEACHTANFWGEFEDYCIYIGPQVGIDENEYGISIYPNPVHDVLNISSTSLIDNIEVYSQDGKLIYFTDTPTTTIETGNFAPGIYLIRMKTENGIITDKFSKY